MHFERRHCTPHLPLLGCVLLRLGTTYLPGFSKWPSVPPLLSLTDGLSFTSDLIQIAS